MFFVIRPVRYRYRTSKLVQNNKLLHCLEVHRVMRVSLRRANRYIIGKKRFLSAHLR